MYPSNRVPYLRASFGEDSIVSESAVAPLFSNSIYTAHPPKNIIVKIYFSYSRSEAAKAIIKKYIYTNKVLSYSDFYMISHCNNIIKQVRDRFVHSASQLPAVLHTASLFITDFIPNMNVTSQILQVR